MQMDNVGLLEIVLASGNVHPAKPVSPSNPNLSSNLLAAAVRKAKQKPTWTHRIHARIVCGSIPYRHFYRMGLFKGLLHIVAGEAPSHKICAANMQDIHRVLSPEAVALLSQSPFSGWAKMKQREGEFGASLTMLV